MHLPPLPAGYDSSVGGKGTVDSVAGLLGVDTTTYLALLTVTGVLAPVLEETGERREWSGCSMC